MKLKPRKLAIRASAVRAVIILQAIKVEMWRIDELMTEGWAWTWTPSHKSSMNVKRVLRLNKPSG